MSANLNLSAGVEPHSSAEQQLRLALMAGRMGIWELALGGDNRLAISPELGAILGLDDRLFDGQVQTFLSRIVHPADQKRVFKTLSKAIRHARDPELEFRFGRPEGSPGWLLGRGRIGYDHNGRPQHIIGVAVDITAQKLAEQEIRRLNAELESRVAQRTAQLEATNKELEAFCYSVSHDLRAPLRSIRGFNEVLQERYGPKLDARGQEFLRRACESSHYMDQLIEDLLKLSRVGRSELSREPVSVSDLAVEIAAELRRSEPTRDVDLRVAPGLKAVGDPRLLRIVLVNLLSNAWKFTSKRPQASIEVGFAPSNCAFFVRDNGAGFDPTYAGRLFGVFQRLHAGSEFSGTGIGLATVQRIINRHGGRVWAEGALDQGATFYFSLPRHETI